MTPSMWDWLAARDILEKKKQEQQDRTKAAVIRWPELLATERTTNSSCVFCRSFSPAPVINFYHESCLKCVVQHVRLDRMDQIRNHGGSTVIQEIFKHLGTSPGWTHVAEGLQFPCIKCSNLGGEIMLDAGRDISYVLRFRSAHLDCVIPPVIERADPTELLAAMKRLSECDFS